MIDKLRKKLMVLFLTSTMLVFTLAMLVMMGNSVINAQTSEVQYANNLADSILEQIYSGSRIGELDLTDYSVKAKAWISLSNGTATQTAPECLDTPSDVLLARMQVHSSILSETQVIGTEVSGESRTVYSFTGTKGESYYGIHSTTYKGGSAVNDLILIFR